MKMCWSCSQEKETSENKMSSFRPEEELYKNNFNLPLPSDIVPDSARGYVTVIGELLSPLKTCMGSLCLNTVGFSVWCWLVWITALFR